MCSSGSSSRRVLSVSRDREIIYTGDQETDVVFQIGAWIPDGADGMAFCNDAVTARQCDQHHVRLKTAAVHRGNICHEVGHSVGLTHPDDADPPTHEWNTEFGCMQNAASAWDVLGGHNRRMINGTD